jgi:hypothetical protein
MLRRVAVVRTDVSEELSSSFIRVTRIGELGTTIAVTSNRRTDLVFFRSVRRLLVTARVVLTSQILVTLMKEGLSSSETSVLQEPHGVTLQSTPFFIVNAEKTSNITYPRLLHTEIREKVPPPKTPKTGHMHGGAVSTSRRTHGSRG